MTYANGLDHTRIRQPQYNDGRPGGYRIICIDTPAGEVQVCVSPTGHSVHVHVGDELVFKGGRVR